MRMPLGFAGGLVSLSLAILSAVPPQTQQPPFRAGTTLINVDVYPRRNGRVIEGLTTQDFQVLEDGVPQRVDAFEFIRTESMTPDADRRDPGTKEEGDRLAADPHNRVFVVYFDIVHSTFEGAHLTRGPVLEFLTRTIGATDLFSVMTSETSPDRMVFGRRIDTLQGELANTFEWGLRNRQVSTVGRTPMEAQLQSCMSGRATLLGDGLVALYREDLMMTNLERTMVRLSALREGRKNVLFMSEGWVPMPRASIIASLATGTIPRVGQGPGGSMIMDPRLTTTGESATWCDQQMLRLGTIDFEERFRALLADANRANVSFYTVNIGGLQTSMPALTQRRSMSLCSSSPTDAECRQNNQNIEEMLVRMEAPSVAALRTLSENTDGIAIFNTNDLGAGFRRIADDLSAYYLLGYSSTNTKPDGKFRRIEVRIKQPNVNITARRGYLAINAESRAAGAAAAAAAAVNTVAAPVAGELGRLSRLRPDAELFSYGVVRDGRLHVAVEISGQEMARGRWSAGADVEATLMGVPGGDLAGRARIEPGARGAVVEIALPAGSAGPWRTSLRVTNQAAVLNDRLEVADAQRSGAPLIAQRSGAPLLGAPILFRGTASARIPLRPVADFQFRRSERVRVEWPAPAALDERIARVLDRRGAPLPLAATVTEVDGPSGKVVNVDLLLAPLAEGDYLIELSAAKAGQTERGLLAFRVVR